MEEEQSQFLIDIDKVLELKMGKKSKLVPRFLVSYLKRIIHQDEINDHLRSCTDKVGVDFLDATLSYLNNHFEVRGIENLPKEGLCTFVSNHPMGAQDGMGLGLILGRHYDGNVKYLVNDLLMNLHNLAPLCIPINKTGAQSKNFPKQVEMAFKSQSHIIMFPAGLCSRRTKGVIHDVDWKKSFIIKSVQSQRDVVPIYFDGRNSDFFYRLANFTRFLGIKINLAMLYLSDEMYKNRNKTFQVTIGKPIPWQTFNQMKSATEWAKYVEDIVYKLA